MALTSAFDKVDRCTSRDSFAPRPVRWHDLLEHLGSLARVVLLGVEEVYEGIGPGRETISLTWNVSWGSDKTIRHM